MALALLRFGGVEGDVAHFDAELGINQWYVYAIGTDETTRDHGIDVLAAPAHTSDLAGPVPERSRGRVSFDVPIDRFDRENQFMQLMTFRSEQRVGPAVSEVVRVPIGAWRTRASGLSVPAPRPPSRGRTVAFNFVEAQEHHGYSTAMFWQALIGLLPQIIPMVAPLVSNLLGGLFGGGGGAAPGGAAAGAAAGQNPLAQLVTGIGSLLQKPEGKDLLKQIIGAIQGQPAASSAPPSIPPATTSSLNGSPRSAIARAQFVDGGVITGPALAGLLTAVLPQLMPLLQKFATPEMMNTILSQTSPEKTIGALTDIAMDPNRRQFERLWQHTPQVGPSVLPMLLAQMESTSQRTPLPSFRTVSQVSLTFEGLMPSSIHGTSRVAYRAGRDMQVALSLATPRPIKEATVYWYVKDAAKRRTLARGSEKRTSLESGPLAALTIPSASLADLPVNDDYLLCVALVWKDKKGASIGTLRHGMFAWVGEYVFDRVEASRDATRTDAPPSADVGDTDAPPPPDVGEELIEAATSNDPIPLSDVRAYRDFWHRVWEGPFTDDVRTRRIELKYYYTLGTRSDVGRLETRQRKVAGEHDERMLQLKTGLVLSPEALNRLAASLEPGASLSAAHLEALRSPDFRARFAQGALTRLTLRGRAGERAAVWVFPEVKIHDVVLKHADAIADDGQVTSFSDSVVRFPLIALAHVVSARTAR